MVNVSKRFAGVSLCILLCCSGCAGYRFGQSSMYRPDVQTVSVSIAASDSFRPFLGERLTEAVVREIHTKTPYRVTTRETAQSYLEIRLVSDTKSVLGENVFDEPRDLQLDMRADVTWVNRFNQPLSTREVMVQNAFENFIPEGGQSITTAQQDVIDKLARKIVASMEADW